MEEQRMHLLLCEDEIELANALVMILEYSGYTVDVAYDGQEALEHLEANNYDGVLLDIMMPKVDGITVLKEIRAKGDTSPVLLLSAKGELDDRVYGLDCGANDYLPKPFEMKELLARIRVMTRRPVYMNNTVLEVSNIALNRANFELKSEKGSVRLAKKECQMLEMLMLSLKHPISAERFMEKLWGYDAEAEINLVWVYIAYLRKKLKVIHADVQIKEVKTAHYALEDL